MSVVSYRRLLAAPTVVELINIDHSTTISVSKHGPDPGDLIMKLTALFIAVAMVCMVLEGCGAYPASSDTIAEFESGLKRANQAFSSGFADRPAQIITLDYRPEPVAARQ